MRPSWSLIVGMVGLGTSARISHVWLTFMPSSARHASCVLCPSTQAGATRFARKRRQERPGPGHALAETRLRAGQVPGALVTESFEGHYGDPASPPPQNTYAHPLVELESAETASGVSHAEQGSQAGERFKWLAHLINRFGHMRGFDVVAQVRMAESRALHGLGLLSHGQHLQLREMLCLPACTRITRGRGRPAIPAAHVPYL